MSEIQITDEAFRPAAGARRQVEPELPPAVGFLRDSWRRLRKNKAAVIALALTALRLIQEPDTLRAIKKNMRASWPASTKANNRKTT